MAIAKVFFDVPAGLGLPGLLALAKDKKAKVGDGNFLMFMNRKRTRVSIMFTEDTLFRYAKDGAAITLEELVELPNIVKGEWLSTKTAQVVASWLNKPITSPFATTTVKAA